jgi:hypothetical protein
VSASLVLLKLEKTQPDRYLFSLFPSSPSSKRNTKYQPKAKFFHVKKMASPKGIHDEATEDSDLTFSAADVDKELHPGENQNFEVDPISSDVATSSSSEIKVLFGSLI